MTTLKTAVQQTTLSAASPPKLSHAKEQLRQQRRLALYPLKLTLARYQPSPYLSVTSQLTVESRIDRAEHA